MDLQVRVGGMFVGRCTQDATVTLGTNFVTNRSNKKDNDGVTCTSDGIILMPNFATVNMDQDVVDHPVVQMDNIAIGPF